METIGIGIVGSGFAADVHARALKTVPGVALQCVASPQDANAHRFASLHGIPQWCDDYRDLVRRTDIQIVSIAVPNDEHASVAIAAAEAGKHVIIEKPLCLTLREADEMMAACRANHVKLMYAENLAFAPKYVRARELAQSGALGRVYLVKQSGKHSGPHSAWFWDAARSGGGALLDMGCHGLEFARSLLGKPPVDSVYTQASTQMHAHRTQLEDDVQVLVNFQGGAVALIEASWAKLGGLDDRAEVYGTEGVSYANLIQGNSLTTFSERGYGYAVEKAPETKGWSFTIYEELWNYGYPQEMAHFVDCVRENQEPIESGEDGKAILEILLAAYASAGTGKKVQLPFEPDVARPVDLYLKERTP